MIRAAGGEGAAVVVDHEDPDAVGELVAAVGREQGRLDVLVNDIFGGDRYMQWDRPLWEHDWHGGLRMLQMGVHIHLITGRSAIPLMLHTAPAHGTGGLVVEMTDGTSQANAEFRRNVGFYYDLVKANVERIVTGLTAELENLPVTAVGVTPGWLRSERMLKNFGVTEASWRDACAKTPGSRSPNRPPTSPEVSPRSPGQAIPIAGLARSSPPASSPTPTTSPTPTAADPTAGATWPPTAGNATTAQASTTSDSAYDPHRSVDQMPRVRSVRWNP